MNEIYGSNLRYKLWLNWKKAAINCRQICVGESLYCDNKQCCHTWLKPQFLNLAHITSLWPKCGTSVYILSTTVYFLFTPTHAFTNQAPVTECQRTWPSRSQFLPVEQEARKALSAHKLQIMFDKAPFFFLAYIEAESFHVFFPLKIFAYEYLEKCVSSIFFLWLMTFSV